MANQVNPPIAALSTVDFNTPTGRRVLIDILNQLWLRSGGPVDLTGNTVVSIDAEDSRRLPEIRNLSKKVSYLGERIESIPNQNAEIRELRKRIEALETKEIHFTELKTIKRQLATLETQVN